MYEALGSNSSTASTGHSGVQMYLRRMRRSSASSVPHYMRPCVQLGVGQDMHGDESLAKGLVAKPDGMNVIPRTQRWKEREESQKLSSVSTSVPRRVPIPPQFF